MLVLARKLHETIAIGDNVKVSVVEIGRNQIKLGIEAPKNIPIMRDNAICKSSDNHCHCTNNCCGRDNNG